MSEAEKTKTMSTSEKHEEAAKLFAALMDDFIFQIEGDTLRVKLKAAARRFRSKHVG